MATLMMREMRVCKCRIMCDGKREISFLKDSEARFRVAPRGGYIIRGGSHFEVFLVFVIFAQLPPPEMAD